MIPPAGLFARADLVDVEMPGDSTHVEESEDEQDQGEQANDGQRQDEEQSEAVESGPPLPAAAPPRFVEHRKRLGCHPRPDLTQVVGAASGSRGADGGPRRAVNQPVSDIGGRTSRATRT